MNKVYQKIKPRDKWVLPVVLSLAVIGGLLLFILKISNAASYMSDDSETCINCHVMNPQYVSFTRSSHAKVTTCNDCHVPHNNVVNKYFFKAKDGLRHATMFTFRMEPQVIRIHEAGAKVVQDNCVRCHEDLLGGHDNNTQITMESFHSEARCVDCHREVPHGRVSSLSATPNANLPEIK